MSRILPRDRQITTKLADLGLCHRHGSILPFLSTEVFNATY